MKKRFFTHVSPRAVDGIRRAYAGSGASVSAVMNPNTGMATVVVVPPRRARDLMPA